LATPIEHFEWAALLYYVGVVDLKSIIGRSRVDEDLIDGRIGVHDRNHFEVKLDYTIDSDNDANSYDVGAYFFIPPSLGMNSHTYRKEQFYGDMQTYIRFKTPVNALDNLLDDKDPLSPMCRLRKAVGDLRERGSDELFVRRLSHEIRLFGCMFRANLRNSVAKVERLSKDAPKAAALNSSAAELANEVGRVFEAFRGWGDDIVRADAPEEIIDIYGLVDEFLSLVAEAHLTRTLALMDSADCDAEATKELAGRLAVGDVLRRERSYRGRQGYPQILYDGVPNEHYVYRRGLLKKFVMSVLFLSTRRSRDGQRASELVAAVAAGLAMLFATMAAIWSQRRYGMNTMPFVGALVLSYILKDRIKEWVRHYFGTRLLRWVADYNLAILDPVHGVDMGSLRESFAFIEHDQVPDEVMKRRHNHRCSPVERAGEPEVVMKYEKSVKLMGRMIGRHHGRMVDVNDIMRFNLARFIGRTDDPVAKVRLYNIKYDRVDTVACPKVYHMNVVFTLTARHSNAEPQLVRVRVILDQRGIRRIEEE